MSVRMRRWTTRTGEVKKAWVVDYFDSDGVRRQETLLRRKDAVARGQQVGIDVRAGTHTPVGKSITVAEACDDWIEHVRRDGKERSTVAQCRQHAKHIKDRLGVGQKLSALTVLKVNAFRDNLLDTMSRAMARKVLTSLKWMLRIAQERGSVAQNVATAVKIKTDDRAKRKLEVGVDIPTTDEIKRILAAATTAATSRNAEARVTAQRNRALLVTATMTGLRGSELRGLPWKNVDLKQGVLHVRQRADRYDKIGPPKSKQGHRTVPIGPDLVKILREWRVACPPSDLDLVFPTRTGHIIRHENLVRQIFVPTQLAAGVTVTARENGKIKLDQDGKPVVEPKYSGLHSLRHFYASLCINRVRNGGLELPPKVVQSRLGHASIAMTLDIYGHLFPHDDEGAELVVAERALLG